jgi:copper(I)-binding protein
MEGRLSPVLACALAVLVAAPADRARADATALQIVAPWLRIAPDGTAELFFAAANHAFAPRTILGAETAAGTAPKPGPAIDLPPHETVFVEPGGVGVLLAAPAPAPAPGDIVPLVLLLDGGDRLPVEAIAGAPDDEVGPEILAVDGKRILLLDLRCDQLPEVSAREQAAIGAWILAYLHEPIDERAARSVLNDLKPGCEGHPEAVLLDIVDMMGGEGE